MAQNDMSASLYKTGATIVLDSFKSYFTSMERLREVQRRTDAEFADSVAQYVNKLKGTEDIAQCSSWQQQACAEQIGRWNQYVLELIQIASEGQATTQAAVRNNLDRIQQAYAAWVARIPEMPNALLAGFDFAPVGNRKSNSQRASAQ